MSIIKKKQIFVKLIFSNFVNFDEFGENQYLRNFPFMVNL